MKLLLRNAVMVLVLGLFFSQVGIAQQQGYTETELQSNFSEAVRALPNVLQAQWQSPMDLWVYTDSSDKEAAQALAENVITLAQSEFGQSVCVNVHDGDYVPIVTKCWSAL